MKPKVDFGLRLKEIRTRSQGAGFRPRARSDEPVDNKKLAANDREDPEDERAIEAFLSRQ